MIWYEYFFISKCHGLPSCKITYRHFATRTCRKVPASSSATFGKTHREERTRNKELALDSYFLFITPQLISLSGFIFVMKMQKVARWRTEFFYFNLCLSSAVIASIVVHLHNRLQSTSLSIYNSTIYILVSSASASRPAPVKLLIGALTRTFQKHSKIAKSSIVHYH